MNCGCSCFCFKFWCTFEPRQHRPPPRARRVFLKPDPPENPYEKLKPRDLQPPPLPRKNPVYIELEHLSKGACAPGHEVYVTAHLLVTYYNTVFDPSFPGRIEWRWRFEYSCSICADNFITTQTDVFPLAGLSVLWQLLIELMISCEPLQRPPADVVLHHPALWDSSRVLTFLQDCSDRVEKEVTGAVLATLETGARTVCACDWRTAVDEEVTVDLRKYRSYRGDSVRDLLRALRNKRHHFRELSPSAQELLGSTADSFTDYWLSRFPSLLPHSWAAMQSVRHEPLFAPYYRGDYNFPPPPTDGALPPWWREKQQELLEPRKQPSPSKSSPRYRRRGSDLEGSNSPKDQGRMESGSPRNGSREDEAERENWMKSGQEKGVYRPRMRRRPRKKEEEKVVWSVPP